jgi:hypothetical protein
MRNRINPDTFDAKQEMGHRAETQPEQGEQQTFERVNPATGKRERSQFPASDRALREADGWTAVEKHDDRNDAVDPIEPLKPAE